MDVFDFHCDTLTEIEKRGCGVADTTLHITPEKAAAFDRYIQIGAVWTDRKLSDEAAWERFGRVVDLYGSADSAFPIMTPPDALGAKRAVILAVEGARLLAGKISRLDELYCRGVRILTLGWAGSDCVCGSWDAEDGLTDFGREVVRRCFELGIVPDVSHASRKTTAEVIALAKDAGKAVIASHSNAYSVCTHGRNLTDAEFRDIVALGGIVGVSLYPPHLCGETATVGDVVRHYEHYISLGGENAVVLGCDFDGIGKTPEGLGDISALPRLYEALAECFGERQAKRVFFENARDFTGRNILK